MINFTKYGLNHQKPQKNAKSKNNHSMHGNQKMNEKERVIWTYRLRERDSLQEKWRKTTKNLSGALPSRKERKKFEKVLKK